MEQKIKEYFELAAKIKELKDQQTEIRDFFKTLVSGDMKINVTLDDEVVRFQNKTRKSKKCDWAAFKISNEELYNEVVAESESTYLDVRKVVNR